MKLSFLIATRDRREALARCLDSIESQTHTDREVIVVVDGSTDGTAEMLAERYPQVRAIVLPESGGVGAALQRASETATGEVWVNLDDDALLATPDAAGLVAETLATRPDVDVVCMRVEAPDGTVRHREIPLRSKRLPVQPMQIAYFLGGAVALRAETMRRVGGYPAGIAYGSWENDVAFRLAAIEATILFLPQARVIHHAIPSASNTDNREANYLRNEIRLAATYLPAPYAQVHAMMWIVQQLLQAAANRRLRRAWSGASEALRSWGTLRSDDSRRLTPQQTRRLSRLSGRTWY